ncbi:MAG: SpoIIE family protein phosphatase [Flavobacteriales bacterium]|jgi:serine phosphatase RsbU (regulator of sigma subunit)|nr:SpoIIE family protein phosphatase [Flavobacteriales bacterium]
MFRSRVKNNYTYQKGKQVIFFITLAFSMVGLVINLLTNYAQLTLSLKTNFYVGIVLLLGILVYSFFRSGESCKKIFLYLTWTMVANIIIGQFLSLNSVHHDLIFEKLLLRNITFLIFFIILTGFIVNLKNAFIQLVVLLVSLLIFSITGNANYILNNVALLITMIIGFFLILAFFVNHLNGFIARMNAQRNVLQKRNKEIVDNITYAKKIQKAILPEKEEVESHFKDAFVYYKPKDIVAGDFYWIEKQWDRTLFAVADCTGHGVSAAMVSVVCNYGLNRSVKEYGLIKPGEILDKTREFVTQKFEHNEQSVRDGMDIALCSLKGNILEYAGAYRPLWLVRNGAIIEYKPDKQPIGAFTRQKLFTTHLINLEEGDTIYLFSDGYIDQFGGERRKKLKTKPFQNILLAIQNKSMKEQKRILHEYIVNWKGDLEQVDDICIFGIRI